MRLLVDEHGLDWDDGLGDHAARRFAYTNHTLLPEALEKWPVALFGRLLPRHLEIIYEINRRFLDEVRARFPGDDARVARLSLIDEAGERYVRMAHLASVGSHAVNGVAALHSRAAQADVLRDFHELVAGEVQQRDERRHAAPLPGARQPAPRARSSRRRSATAGCATSSGCARSSRSPRTPASATSGAR